MSEERRETAGTVSLAERIAEALLFASPEPLAREAIAARLPDGTDVDALLEALAGRYAGRGVELFQIAGKWAFRTAPDLGAVLQIETVVKRKLSRAAIETLSIIAYHGPVTRADIEEIRGVAVSKGTLDALLEAGWIQPKGRRNVPGRPLTWGTTDSFLDHFGLASLADLPGLDDLKAAGLLDRRPGLTSIAMGDEDILEEEEDEGAGAQFDLLDLEEGGR